MKKTASLLLKLRAKHNFSQLALIATLSVVCSMILCFTLTKPAAGAGAGSGTGAMKRTWLGEQNKNYEEETKEKEDDAKAKALAKVKGALTNKQLGDTSENRAQRLTTKMQSPVNTNKQAKAAMQAQGNQIGNCAGDIARDQAVAAIDYCSRFMKNFTTEGGNRWNKYRDQIFIPMAILLVLPGAVLTQVKAIIAQSNPIVGQASPWEGIQRGLITVFLVPGTYLVTNYAVDLGNSLHYSICSEYTNLMGSDMYQDAMCAEIRAFGVRYLAENEGSMKVPDPDLSPRGDEPFAKIEGTLWGKIADPCQGLYLVPANRNDASMPQSSIAVRMGMYTANAGICAGWACLTAFQMAFFYYLFFIGPIMAALWAWPTKLFRDAFPNWVEGAVTLAFWSFFWHVTILILALTKAQASTGLYMVTACNVLATCSVKHAFDFASVMRSACGQAEAIGAECAANAQGGGGGGGGGKGGGKSAGKGHKGGGQKHVGTPDAEPATPATPAALPAAHTPAAAEVPADDSRKPSLVPSVLTPSKLPTIPGVIVETTLPPAAQQPAAFNTLDPANSFDPSKPALWQSALINTGSTAAFNDPGNSGSILSLNSVTGVYNPIISTPPQVGNTPMPRNTIGSVIGNAIENVMVYPTSLPIQDPDLVHGEAAQSSVQTQQLLDQLFDEATYQNNIEISSEHSPEEQPSSTSPSETPDQEQEMNYNDDPRLTALRDQRFAFPPPPMVQAQPTVASITADPSLSPQELLAKLQSIADETASFAPPPPPVLPIDAQIPFCGFSRVEENPLRFEGQPINFDVEDEEGTIVTVADFTKDLQGQAQPEARQPNLNNALSGILRNRGAWAQAQNPARPVANNSVSNSWWS